jgi:outer membrane lipoprotein-sorting protein/peroxiredoxin
MPDSLTQTMIPNKKQLHLWPGLACFLALGVMLSPSPVSAQAPDADVSNLLSKVAAAYRNVHELSLRIREQNISGDGEYGYDVRLTFKRPNLIRAFCKGNDGIYHVVADGQYIYSDSSLVRAAYARLPETDTSALVEVLVSAHATAKRMLTNLLFEEDATRLFTSAALSVTRQRDSMVDGVPCDIVRTIRMVRDRPARFDWAFGKADHLLRRSEFGPDTDAHSLTDVRVIETYSDITLQPAITASTFTYTPPAGAVAQSTPLEPVFYDSRIKVGTVPYPITGRDLEGHTVSLDQFKGKVVLLDFWAMWCGPCVAELPDIRSVYTRYHDSGLEVVGISLDYADDRDKLIKYVSDNKMPWPEIYDGRYWRTPGAVKYGLRGIPFTLLVGRDGKIVAVNPYGEEIAGAVEKALAQSLTRN